MYEGKKRGTLVFKTQEQEFSTREREVMARDLEGTAYSNLGVTEASLRK